MRSFGNMLFPPRCDTCDATDWKPGDNVGKLAALSVRGDFSVKGEKIASDDPDGQFPHAFDEAVQDVAALHGSDAGWRSGKDQIARRQSEEL